MLLKALLRGSFSLMIFGWAQILMDIQPLIVIITGKGHLHGFSHTLIGATFIAAVAAATGKPLIETVIHSKWLGIAEADKAFLGITTHLHWPIVVISGFIGTLSHVWIDALMHSDLQPFYPWNLDNPVLGMLTIETLHKACVYTGLIGAAIYFLVQLMLKKRTAQNAGD